MCIKSLKSVPPSKLSDSTSGKLAKENNHAYRKKDIYKDVYYNIMHKHFKC